MAEELTARQEDALEVLQDEPAVSPTFLASEIDVQRQNAYHLLQALIDEGECQKKARGLYTRTQ